MNTSNPIALFQLVDSINANLEPVRRRIHKRSHSVGDRREITYPPHLHQHHQQPQQRLTTPEEEVAPDQLVNFDALYRTNRRYAASWFSSWKNRYYGERIVYLFDIASTIWILAICPIFLFTVIIILFWLAYYIRQNIHELEDTNKHIAVMNKLANKRVANKTTTTDDDGDEDDDVYSTEEYSS